MLKRFVLVALSLSSLSGCQGPVSASADSPSTKRDLYDALEIKKTQDALIQAVTQQGQVIAGMTEYFSKLQEKGVLPKPEEKKEEKKK